MRQIDLSPSISRHPRKRGPCSESHKNWGPCFTSPKNSEGPVKIFLPVTTCSYPSPTRAEPTSRARPESIESDLVRPCGQLAACRVLPPALLHRLIVLAGARTRIGRLRVPIALEKGAEDVVAPVVAARNGDSDRRPAHQEAALGLVVEHRDELGAIVGLAAQRLVRDDDRGSRQCSRRDAIEHILRDGEAVERVLVILHAEIIGLPLVHLGRRDFAIDLHPADGANVAGRFYGENGIGLRVHPSLALVFELKGGAFDSFRTEIASDDAQSEIHAGSKPACAGQVAFFDEPRAALHLNVRKFHFQVGISTVMSSSRFAVEQSGSRQDERAGANGHSEVGGLRCFADPIQHRVRVAVLRGNHNDFRRRRALKSVLGHDLHSAAYRNRVRRFRHGVKVEGAVHHGAAGNIRILKNLPRAREIDEHRPFGNYKGHGYRSAGRRFQRAQSDRYFRDVPDPRPWLPALEPRGRKRQRDNSGQTSRSKTNCARNLEQFSSSKIPFVHINLPFFDRIEKRRTHSLRSARIGSIDAARRAGRKLASSADAVSTSATTMYVAGSLGATSKSSALSTPVMARDPLPPKAMPITVHAMT